MVTPAHTVTITFDRNGYESQTLNCNAPSESLCHAVFDCSCEQWHEAGVKDGAPFHLAPGFGTEYVHTGRFAQAECNLRVWFDETGEAMVGSVTVPVVETWEGDFYTFTITPPEPRRPLMRPYRNVAGEWAVDLPPLSGSDGAAGGTLVFPADFPESKVTEFAARFEQVES